jgi:hypothetical protein
MRRRLPTPLRPFDVIPPALVEGTKRLFISLWLVKRLDPGPGRGAISAAVHPPILDRKNLEGHVRSQDWQAQPS